MTVSAATVTQYYTGIFRTAPSAAVSAAYQAMSSDTAALSSMLSAANLQVDPVVRLYQTAFNRLPDTNGMTAWVTAFNAGAITLQQIATGFTQSTEFTTLYPTTMSNAQFVGALYYNILQRTGEDAGIAGWVNALNSGALTRAQVLLGFSNSDEFKTNIESAVNTFLTNIANTPVANQGDASLYTGTLFDLGGPVTTYTLTTGADTFGNAALASKQVFNAQPGTFTVFDTLTGGSNTSDALNINESAAFANPAVVTVTNIEHVNMVLAAAGTVDTTAAAGFTGVTNLDVKSISSANNLAVTAAGTTVVRVESTPTTKDTTIDGGSSVRATVMGVASGDLTIGANTEATADVTAIYSTSYTAGAAGDIEVNGGTTVRVDAIATNAVNTTVIFGKIDVNGGASTTSVTVNQTAQATAAADVAGVTNSPVTITDATGAAADTPDTIATVTLTNAGPAIITSSALTDLSLSGGALVAGKAGNVTLTKQSTTQETTLNLVASGYLGTIAGTQADAYTTININANGFANIDNLTSADVEVVNFTGSGNTYFTANAFGAAAGLTEINVTGTGGAQLLGAAIGTGVAFTGGAGNDYVTVGATTVAIAMGGGTNTVGMSVAVGAGGSVDGGTGTADTLSMSSTNAAARSANATFEAGISNFEILSLGATGAADTVNVANLDDISTVYSAGVTAGGLTLSGLAATNNVTFTAAVKAASSLALASATGTGDVVNLAFSATDAFSNTAVLTIADVETVNVDVTDTVTTATPTAGYVAALKIAAATTLDIDGNVGLDLTGSTFTALVSLDASGVTGEDAWGGVTATLTTTTGNTVIGGSGDDVLVVGNAAAGKSNSLTGGAGNDSLTGGNGIDVITGGDGDDEITSGAGLDTLTGGDGADTFIVDVNANGNTYASVADFTADDSLDLSALELNGGPFTTTLGAAITLAPTAAFADYLNAAAADDGSTTSVTNWFTYGGNTYIVVDNSAGNTFENGVAADQVVSLTGVVDLTDAAITANVLTLA